MEDRGPSETAGGESRLTRRRLVAGGAVAAAAAAAGAGGLLLALRGSDEEAPPESTARPLPEGADYTGVSSRTLRQNTSFEHRRYPWLRLASAYVPWRWLEPRRGQFSWGTVDASLDDAAARGYKVILRIECGYRAPGWLYGPTDHVRPIRLANTVLDQITIPVPWDQNLPTHYRELLAEVERHLQEPDGRGGRRADHLYFLPVAMPTEVGTEMAMGYQAADQNRAAWDAVGSEAARQRLLEAAWRTAVDAHLELIRSVPSCIAYGPLFADGYAAARRIALDKVPSAPDRLWSMTTNLQCPAGGGGYEDWNPSAAEVMRTAADGGGTIGFQTAGSDVLGDPAVFRCAVEDGLGYGIRFLETSPELLREHEDYLEGIQRRLGSAAST